MLLSRKATVLPAARRSDGRCRHWAAASCAKGRASVIDSLAWLWVE